MANQENPDKHVHSAGMALKWSVTGTANTFTYIDEIVTVDTPPIKRSRIPTSTIRSPNKIMKKMPGWHDLGEVGFEVALTRAQLTVLFNHYWAGTNLYWNEIYPNAFDGSTVGFLNYRAWIGDFQAGAGMQRDQDELINCKMMLVLTVIDSTYFVAGGTGSG